jgi:hypothetical protein
MREAVEDILRRLLEGSELSPEEVLWGTLVCAFVLSTLHLLTMYLTRWGERRVTGKALIFSLMMHFVFGVGLVTVIPPPVVPGGDPEEEEHKLVIRSVPPADERRTSQESKQPAAVWDRLPKIDEAQAAPPDPKLPEPIAPSTERIQEAGKPNKPKTPDLAALPEDRRPTPTPPPATDQPPASSPATTPEIEAPKERAAAKPDTALPPLEKPAAVIPAARPDVARQSPPAAVPGSRPGPKQDPSDIPSTSDPGKPVASVSAARQQERPKTTAPSAPLAPEAQPRPSKEPSSKPPSVAAIKPRIADPSMQASIDRLRIKDRPTVGDSQKKQRPADYQPVDTDAAAPSPDVKRAATEPLIVRRSKGVPATYRLRKLSSRKENARRYGGTDKSEVAVEASLRWLANAQHRDGYWDADAYGAGKVRIDENGVDRDYAGRDADSGVTALAILAFLGAGYTHEEGQYADNVERALRWLIGQQQADGNLGASAGHFAMMYCHGMATYAIAEAYGMQNDPTSNTMLREPLVRAVRFILENQNPKDGGWRYRKGQRSDMSMFGWQLMALKSAEFAGVSIPNDAKNGMISFLRDRSLGSNGGLAGYREQLPASPSMTAEALFCKQMLGLKRASPTAKEATDYLLSRLPKVADPNEYYWYYGTLAMHQQGGEAWQTWNLSLRDLLISQQRTSGNLSGSWDPIGPWAQYGGRIYSTALSTLCLEVYYRFLPLYQLGETVSD